MTQGDGESPPLPASDALGLVGPVSMPAETIVGGNDPEYFQPKKQFADLAEATGILVPKRYPSFGNALEAVGRGGTIIVRSEHAAERDGASGLFDSYVISSSQLQVPGERPNDLVRALMVATDPETALQQVRLAQMQKVAVRQYSAVMGYDTEQFVQGLSFSFWEFVQGINLTVVADDAGPDRYHIMGVPVTAEGVRGLHGSGWVTNESGHTIVTYQKAVALPQETLANIVRQYEIVRNLPGFSAGQCPIMEMQLDANNQCLPLQYQEGRTYRPYDGDRLDPKDYPSSKGWHRAETVRGALGPLVTLETAMWYPPDYGTETSRYALPQSEDASFNLRSYTNVGMGEALSRRRRAYFAARGLRDVYEAMSYGHEARSGWFKPQAAFAIGRNSLRSIVPPDLECIVNSAVNGRGQMARVVIDAASDGRSGFVRLNREAEQPVYSES